MTTKTARQRDRILYLLIQQGAAGVTRQDAAQIVGCFELASRIGELEADGCRIERRRFTATNRFGDRVHGTRYVLASVPRDVYRDMTTRVEAAS
jgi:hypothetical protein